MNHGGFDINMNNKLRSIKIKINHHYCFFRGIIQWSSKQTPIQKNGHSATGGWKFTWQPPGSFRIMGRLALSKGVLTAAWLATGMTIGANMYLELILAMCRGSVGRLVWKLEFLSWDFGISGIQGMDKFRFFWGGFRFHREGLAWFLQLIFLLISFCITNLRNHFESTLLELHSTLLYTKTLDPENGKTMESLEGHTISLRVWNMYTAQKCHPQQFSSHSLSGEQ